MNPLVLSELTPALDITLIDEMPKLELLDEFFAKKAEAKDFVVGKDVETTPLKDYFFRRMRTIQFGDQNKQFVIDLLPLCGNDPETLFNTQGYYGARLNDNLSALALRLSPVTESNQWTKVGVNLGFEYNAFYWLFGRRTFGFYDCAYAERCIWAGAHGLKQYSFYSMAEMMERYFKTEIDKALQESFTLDGILTTDQIGYAALDTRLPLGIKAVQQVIATGATLKQLKDRKSPIVKYVAHLEPQTPNTGEPVIMGDNLQEIIQIENDVIGAFEDMHIHGENLDQPRWMTRVELKMMELNRLYADELDPVFIPLVGDKRTANTDAEIEEATQFWKSYNTISDVEIEIKKSQRKFDKTSADWEILETNRVVLETARKERKEALKKKASDMSKHRTKVRKLAAKSEGNALINYGSDAQLKNVLKTLPGLKSIKTMDDAELEKFEHVPVMVAIRKLHGLLKELGTYGRTWATTWTTKPCKEEGWLHPGDGRLHCVFNQYDAETGRSSSEKPNGQNLPQDKEVRSSFIADPPNESIRISDCCNADTQDWGSLVGVPVDEYGLWCSKCQRGCTTHAETYQIITADMSGAELRIIAELAQDPIWISAFARGEDVHSVGTEILYEEVWAGLALENCEYFKKHTEETVAQNALCVIGDAQKQKCKCPQHAELRNNNKATNFLLAYGGGPNKLAGEIKKTKEEAAALMLLHSKKFPLIWAYLEKSGKDAKLLKKSFDMFGRRRLFPEPTWERAKEKFKHDKKGEKALRLDEKIAENKVAAFVAYSGRKPTDEEKFELTHRNPTSKEIGRMMGAMGGSIERQGKNHSIQGTNATIIKLAMGCGYDVNGEPYLWHTFPKYRAKLIKMVHDELVVNCPTQYAEEVAALIGDAFRRAAVVKMKSVEMTFDFHIAAFWSK